MRREETPANGLIFPAPPNGPHAGVVLKVMRNVWIQASGRAGDSFGTLVSYVGGFGPDEDSRSLVHTELKENVWVPEPKSGRRHLGVWKQEVTFRSSFSVQCAPTFESINMRVGVSAQFHRPNL